MIPKNLLWLGAEKEQNWSMSVGSFPVGDKVGVDVIWLGEIYGRTVVTSPPLSPQQTSTFPHSDRQPGFYLSIVRLKREAVEGIGD